MQSNNAVVTGGPSLSASNSPSFSHRLWISLRRRGGLWLVLAAGAVYLLTGQVQRASLAPREPALQQDTGDQVIQLPPVPTRGAAKRQDGVISVLVELYDPPAAKVYADKIKESGLPEAQARAAAVVAGRDQVQRILSAQERVGSLLANPKLGAREFYRVQKSYNGIAVEVSAKNLDVIRRLPGVKDVHILELEYPTNSTTVPFVGTPQLWGNNIGLGTTLTGAGVRMGIIDTGIDYQHANFGGTGLLADYQANNRTAAPDAYFPTAKVVGGTDFAGDGYNGTAGTIAADPDPMDCNGHGSHVAGTAAGYGVKSDGTPFTGPFNTSTPFSSLRIGPGNAPGASLYAIRIFGCGGGTNLTIQGIDWAMDPNGDNDLSDHLDVINMSLGSDNGNLSSTSAQAADNAADAGIVVVASAGNAGDTTFIGGAPAAGSRVISVAASADPGPIGAVATTVRANSPAVIAGYYQAGGAQFGTTPPAGGITGNVVQALDPADGAGPLTTDACSPLTNAAAVAGNIAFVDRGTCGFNIKAENAQNAGAIAVIIASNSATAIGGMAGVDPTVTIPSQLISQADGNTFRTNLGNPLNITMFSPADTMASFSSRGPRGGASGVRLKPDITAPGLSIESTQSGVTCTGTAPSTGCLTVNSTGYIPGSQLLNISGTSMASPFVAGIIALLKQEHPTWTVEELKALAMNGAVHDLTTFGGGGGSRYSPARVGAGRVDPVSSALLPIIAYNADEPGLVSVTFDSVVPGTLNQVKHIRVVNPDTIAHTYDLGVDTVVDAPGVAFSLPGGSSVTIAPGQTADLSVQMSANASQMKHTRDATMPATLAAPAPLTSLGNVGRIWLTEEAGYLTFSLSGTLKLRVPLYATPRAVSAMAAASAITTGGAPTGSTTLPLSGTDICTGTLGPGPACTGTFPNDEVSLVTPFELQAVSPRDPVNAPGFADIQYAGVNYDSVNGVIYFGVSMWDKWSSPEDLAVNIYIDNNSDGVYDRILFETSTGGMAVNLFGTQTSANDSFITGVFNISTSGVSIPGGMARFVDRADPQALDTALFNNNVMYFGASPATLGLATATTPFKYKVVTCPGFEPLCLQLNGFKYDQAVGPYSWSTATQGLNFSNTFNTQDLNGATLPVTWNTANMTANGSLGALLLHTHNDTATTAQVVTLDTAAQTDLAITNTVSTSTPSLGANVTLTVAVANDGPQNASGVVVTDQLPAGLIYVSDDGGSAYDPATGLYTVGALSNGASATLHIIATVNTSDLITDTAVITSRAPLDPIAGNDRATVTINAPSTSDLSLTETAGSTNTRPGQPVTFTFTVTNVGTDTANDVDVANTFPAFPALHAASYTASQGAYNPATGHWNIAVLGRGAAATLTITVNAPNTPGPLVNNSSVSESNADPNVTNDLATATISIIRPTFVDADADSKSDYIVLQDGGPLGPRGIDLTKLGSANNGPVMSAGVVVRGQYFRRPGERYDPLAPTQQQLPHADVVPHALNWHIKRSSDGMTVDILFGTLSDIPAPADFNGDGQIDLAVWTPGVGAVKGKFHVLLSPGYTATASYDIGSSVGDPSVVGDYDGDGLADPAVFDFNTGKWEYLGGANHDQDHIVTAAFSHGGTFPIPGDFNGDGKLDYAIETRDGLNPSSGHFYIAYNNGTNTVSLDDNFVFGNYRDVVAPGDYDGDGITDITLASVIVNPIAWRIRPSADPGHSVITVNFGDPATDYTAPADYDGDGKLDISIYRDTGSGAGTFDTLTSASNWTLKLTPSPVPWGVSGNYPVAYFNTH